MELLQRREFLPGLGKQIRLALEKQRNYRGALIIDRALKKIIHLTGSFGLPHSIQGRTCSSWAFDPAARIEHSTRIHGRSVGEYLIL
jgi:hypothetical protein